MGEQGESDTERRVTAVISRFSLKVMGSMLATATVVLIAWGTWLSAEIIGLGNDRAAHSAVHSGIDQRLVAGNERMNIIQADIQKMGQDQAALRGEYEAIKRQLREGRWKPSSLEPSPSPAPTDSTTAVVP